MPRPFRLTLNSNPFSSPTSPTHTTLAETGYCDRTRKPFAHKLEPPPTLSLTFMKTQADLKGYNQLPLPSFHQ